MNTAQLPRHKPSPLEGVLALLASILVFTTLSLNESSLHLSYRETLVLRLVEGMTGPEIATRTGLTPDSVRVNLHRGFKLLREKLVGENV